MNCTGIDEALKENGKAILNGNDKEYAYINPFGNLVWYDVELGAEGGYVELNDILKEKWSPYPVVRGINPKEAGELWAYSYSEIARPGHWYSEVVDGGRVILYSHLQRLDNTGNITHGQDGWTRIHPPVESENVERMELTEVVFKRESGVTFPEVRGDGDLNELCDKPPAKMIVEIPKDKQ